MSKRKPDQVIEFRISLQDKERELLEHIVYVEGTAKAFNQFTEPFVEIVKDVSAMSLIFGALAAYGGWTYVVSPGIEDAQELFEDFMQQYDVERKARTAAGEAVGGVGGLVPGPLGPLFRFLGIYIQRGNDGGGGGGGGF
jgi:hypothetical protein